MDGISMSRLREMCDKHQDGRGCPCPAWVTQLNVDHLKQIRDAANIALNIHNQNGKNNFILETVYKLNFVCEYLCMTFSAKNAETNESCLFRGVVHATADTVLLCEIKEPRHIGIPSDRVGNYVEALSESKAHRFPYKWMVGMLIVLLILIFGSLYTCAVNGQGSQNTSEMTLQMVLLMSPVALLMFLFVQMSDLWLTVYLL